MEVHFGGEKNCIMESTFQKRKTALWKKYIPKGKKLHYYILDKGSYIIESIFRTKKIALWRMESGRGILYYGFWFQNMDFGFRKDKLPLPE